MHSVCVAHNGIAANSLSDLVIHRHRRASTHSETLFIPRIDPYSRCGNLERYLLDEITFGFENRSLVIIK